MGSMQQLIIVLHDSPGPRTFNSIYKIKELNIFQIIDRPMANGIYATTTFVFPHIWLLSNILNPIVFTNP